MTDANDRKQRGESPETETREVDPPGTSKLQPLLLPGTPKAFDFARTELVRLDKLPSPPGWRAHAHAGGNGAVEPDAGYGMGTFLNDILGGGIGRGEALVLGAAGPGAGKTHLLGQWAEGLALRCEAMLKNPEGWAPSTRTLTPVIVLSELMPTALLGRAVARWTGIDGNVFRQGRHWKGYVTNGERGESINAEQAERIANAAVMEGGDLAPLLHWMRRLPIPAGGSPLSTIDEVKAAAAGWAKQLREVAASHDFDIVPVVMIDPIQRYQGADDDEIRALNVLVEGIHDAAIAEGFAMLCTSDTNKDSTTGGAGGRAKNEREARERGAKVLRGSNKLLHLVDASIYIDRDWDRSLPAGFGETEIGIGKNRHGTNGPPFARFRWHFQTGRMFACTEIYCSSLAVPPDGQAVGKDSNGNATKPPVKARC